LHDRADTLRWTIQLHLAHGVTRGGKDTWHLLAWTHHDVRLCPERASDQAHLQPADQSGQEDDDGYTAATGREIKPRLTLAVPQLAERDDQLERHLNV
jgi:hypothetical protein